MPAASSDDARGASSAASVLAPSEGETEDPRISAYVAHLAHVGDEMAAGLGALFADAFPEVPTLPLSTIRRQGGWGPKSRVPSDRYIDHQCPPSIAGRRFFDWLTPDGRLRRLGAS